MCWEGKELGFLPVLGFLGFDFPIIRKAKQKRRNRRSIT